MAEDPTIEWIGSPNYRNILTAKHGVVFHWIVGYLASADARFKQAHQTATQYAVGPDAIHQYVKDELYAPGTGHNGANLNYISIEHEAGYMVDGVRFPGSAATLENSAQLVAYLSSKHGWGKMVPGVNAFEHNDFVATMCPGTLPWHWICDRANEINGDPAAPGNPGASIIAAGLSAWGLVDIDAMIGTDDTKELQRQLGIEDDGVAGPITNGALQARIGAHVDQLFGSNSIRALQEFVDAEVDAEWGSETTAKTKAAIAAGKFKGAGPAPAPASTAKLVVDGKRGVLTIKAEQRALGVEADGIFGRISIKAEQIRVGAKVDGIRGPETIKAVQRHVGLTGDDIDGIEGPITIAAEQRALNAGTF